MNNFPVEQSLFDDFPAVGNSVTELKKTEVSEPPQTGEIKEDWSDDFDLIVELIGSESAWKLAEHFAGSTMYIPKNILINKNYHDIRRKFKAGKNYRELSAEYGYTETHIRNIIHKK